MIEVVFGDSAGGTLKAAQNYGKRGYSVGAFGVIVSHAGGSKPTEEEIRAAQQEADDQARLEWENGVPMGGDPADVYSFHLMLSIGDVSEDVPGERRRRALKWLYGVYPHLFACSDFTEDFVNRAREALGEISAHISAGESVRVWYSNQPDEHCGLYWFMAQIYQLEPRNDQVILVALPDWEDREDGTVITHSGWSGVKPGDWHRYVGLQKAATPAFCRECASHWKRLQQENAPLRALLNGRLVSAQEALYDEYIIREIEAEEAEFPEAMVIGKVMMKYNLGVSDAWIAQRIECMIASGGLVPVTQPATDSPIYHRRLKKRVD